MSDTALRTPATVTPQAGSTLRTIGGLMRRDTRVLQRELPSFLIRTVMQPFLFVFVFAYVFPKIGQGFQGGSGEVSFATILVPGLVAVAIVFQGIIAVALPLSVEFGGTREIEDRVMAPVPVAVVGIEKILFGAAQSLLAGIVVFPLVYLVPATDVSVSISNWPLLIVVGLLASLVSGALGLTLGTFVKPQQIGLMFSIVVLPLTFLGCVYYPWAALEPVRWLQLLVLANPLVYMSEGLRTTLTPDLPHMGAPAFLTAIVIALALLTFTGLRGFVRRTVG